MKKKNIVNKYKILHHVFLSILRLLRHCGDSLLATKKLNLVIIKYYIIFICHVQQRNMVELWLAHWPQGSVVEHHLGSFVVRVFIFLFFFFFGGGGGGIQAHQYYRYHRFESY